MCFPSHTNHPLKTESDREGRVGRRITPAMSLLVLPVCIYYSWVCCCIWFVVLFSFQCSSLCFSSPLWNSWNTFSDFYLCSCVLCICSTWLPPFGHTAVCMGWHCLCFPWNRTGHHPKTTGDTGLLELSTESMNWDSATYLYIYSNTLLRYSLMYLYINISVSCHFRYFACKYCILYTTPFFKGSFILFCRF